MAKRSHKQSVAKQGDQQIMHASYEEDDNMLPAPEVLHQYQQMDDRFIDWFMKRADMEQSARIKFNDARVRIARSTNNKLFSIDMISMILTAGLTGIIIWFSYELIKSDHVVTGSIFGGITVFGYAISLINRRSIKKTEK